MKEETIKQMQRALGVEDDGDIGPITRKALFDKLISIAKNEIGVCEIGTSNKGVRVGEYQSTTSLGGTGWPWCAAFICWIFKTAKIFSENNRPKSASAFGFESWGKSLGISVIRKPKEIKKGDIVIYSFSHIGIAETNSSGSGSFYAIEGNTDSKGSREGGCVARKQRWISSVRSVVRF